MMAMTSLSEKHRELQDNPGLDIGEDYIEIVIDLIDIHSLPSPRSLQQQLDSIEVRQNVLRKMALDSVYDEPTRKRIAERAKIPIRNNYVSPLKRLMLEKGIDPTKQYRVFYRPDRREYIFYQAKGPTADSKANQRNRC